VIIYLSLVAIAAGTVLQRRAQELSDVAIFVILRIVGIANRFAFAGHAGGADSAIVDIIATAALWLIAFGQADIPFVG
jgi:hypothetical protein